MNETQKDSVQDISSGFPRIGDCMKFMYTYITDVFLVASLSDRSGNSIQKFNLKFSEIRL